MNPTPTTIDQYIADFPPDVQERLQQVRAAIHKAAPDAQETISYKMPGFRLNDRYLVNFAGYKKHIGFYPAPIGVAEFKEALAPYATGKGSVQFPLDKPIPFDLIDRIVKYQVQQSHAQAEARRKK